MAEPIYRFIRPTANLRSHEQIDGKKWMIVLNFCFVIPSEFGEFESIKSGPVICGSVDLTQLPEASIAFETQRWTRDKIGYISIPKRPLKADRDFDRMVMECLQAVTERDAVDVPDLEALREEFRDLHLALVNANIKRRYQWLYKTTRRPPRVWRNLPGVGIRQVRSEI